MSDYFLGSPRPDRRTDPDGWLRERLAWLRTTLCPRRDGRCVAYVIDPDGVVHARDDRRWESRHWAYVAPRAFGGGWVVVRTISREDRPRYAGDNVVAVYHTIGPAQRDARGRARSARANLAREQRWQAEVDYALVQGTGWWATDEFDGLIGRMPVGQARWVLCRLLATVQDGYCAVCGQVPVRFVLDHDHDTGLVRGALCPKCNGSEGSGTANERLARQLRAYRASPPAEPFGWHWPTDAW